MPGTFQSRHHNRHMMNIYLTDSDGVAIVDFVKDHEKLCNKTNEQFKGHWKHFSQNL